MRHAGKSYIDSPRLNGATLHVSSLRTLCHSGSVEAQSSNRRYIDWQPCYIKQIGNCCFTAIPSLYVVPAISFQKRLTNVAKTPGKAKYEKLLSRNHSICPKTWSVFHELGRRIELYVSLSTR